MKYILNELDLFFKEMAFTEDEIAKFLLCPIEGQYFTWQLQRYKKDYENKNRGGNLNE